MGGQSSGKSTLINSLIGLPVLPVSEEMCTKVPLSINIGPLSESATDSRTCVIFLTTSMEKKDKRRWEFSLADGASQTENIKDIQSTIQTLSDELVAEEGDAENNMPMLHMEIRSTGSLSLSLVDLPGLTMTDRSDLNGSASSADRLRRIAIRMTSPNDTAILAVMPARIDVEVDIAWGVLKSVDPDGIRTAVVLTKADLLNPSAAFEDMLTESGSGSVHADLGYFVVMLKDAEGERSFFEAHPTYSKALCGPLSDKFGTASVRRLVVSLADTMVSHMMNDIKEKLDIQFKDVSDRYRELGGEKQAPDDTGEGGSPAAWLAHNVNRLHTALDQSLRGHRGPLVSMGGERIASVLRELRDDLSSVSPIRTVFHSMDEEEGDSNGIHLPETSIVTLLEGVMQTTENVEGEKLTALQSCLRDIAKSHLATIVDVVTCVGNQICVDIFGAHRSLLVSRVAGLLSEVCAECSSHCLMLIDSVVLSESSYVWSDCEEFRFAVHNRDLAAAVCQYESDLMRHMMHVVPKLVVYAMTTRVAESFESLLFKSLLKHDVDDLIHEDQVVVQERQIVKHVLDQIHECQQLCRQMQVDT